MRNKDPKKYHNPKLTPRARALWIDMTPQEAHLWYDFLKGHPVKFYRQRVIDIYIADFYCAKAKLVIELDGAHHYTQDGAHHDKNRTIAMKTHGFRVVRFSNSDIDDHFDDVCKKIDRLVKFYCNE